jgi:hypothetical protein
VRDMPGGLAEGEDVRVLPRSGHSFHEACVDARLWSSATCPSCRVAIIAESPSPTPADQVVDEEDMVANGGECGGLVASTAAVGGGDAML